jgi:hypothetical protein
MKPRHRYDIELQGDRYVGKTRFYQSISQGNPPPVVGKQLEIPLSEGGEHKITIHYQLWDISDFKSEMARAGIRPKPDIIILLIDPSRPETLTRVADEFIPVAYLSGVKTYAAIVNHIPNRVEKMTMIHVRDYIRAACNLPFPVYVFEGDVADPRGMERILQTIISLRHQTRE